MFDELTCVLCNWTTKDANQIEMINDGLVFSSQCPKCEGEFWKWESPYDVRVTLNGDYLESEKKHR
jgi:NAD-dependent SIR2 family protein deacetylase